VKKLLVSALALAAIAGAAQGQIDPTRFGIDISPMFRTYSDNMDGTFTAMDVGTNYTVNTRTSSGGGATTVRLELRYAITVSGSTTGSYTSGGSTFASGGLAATSVNVAWNNPLSAGTTLATAAIGGNGGAGSGPNTGNGFSNPDGGIDPGSGYGMYAPWRTGVFPTDQTFSGNNGTRIGNTIDNILPLTTGAPDQRSSASTTRRWSFYAFNINLPANYATDASGQQVVTFQIVRGISNGTPAPFLFFPRINGANGSAAIEGAGSYTVGSATLTILGAPIPAPASAALLGVGGLVAARRRRN
jgi:hypothetical protein